MGVGVDWGEWPGKPGKLGVSKGGLTPWPTATRQGCVVGYAKCSKEGRGAGRKRLPAPPPHHHTKPIKARAKVDEGQPKRVQPHLQANGE
jgi:hypothetical protein